jgi:hypothetical protein
MIIFLIFIIIKFKIFIIEIIILLGIAAQPDQRILGPAAQPHPKSVGLPSLFMKYCQTKHYWVLLDNKTHCC